MTTLTSLLLSNNAFVGTLPASFSQLTLLRELLIDDNNLTGDPIPVLNALPLWILMANKNNFTAKIDSSFLAGNPFLTWVDVSHNGFYSKDFFPEHLFRKPLLEVLDFGHNRLSGNVSANVSNARALLYLALNDNRLTGPLTGFSNLKSLRRLDVSNNMLTGDMDAIGSLPSLYLLFLSGNPFTPGTIPKSFTNLVNLTELSLRNTNRVGPLPEFVNPRLELLDLGSNNLNSTVPESYAQFPNLTYILLNNNTNIRGSLPAAFSELRTLKGGFFDGTDLNANTIEILCRHDNFATVESDEVITADCVSCPCNQIVCKCCPPEDVEGCSRPLLAGVDMSWENLFQREKYSFRNVSADGGGGNTSPGWVGSE